MPGQDSAIKDLTKTFDLPRGIGATTNPEILSGLIVAQAGRLRKFVELSPEVKNLFLQIYRFTGAEIWEFYSVCGNIKLPAQNRLADAEPPFFDHRSSIGRRLLEKPGRDQSFLRWGKSDHKCVD
jgi:hypothetical protein